MQDTWYRKEEIHLSSCDDSMWDDRQDLEGYTCDAYVGMRIRIGAVTKILLMMTISPRVRCVAGVVVESEEHSTQQRSA